MIVRELIVKLGLDFDERGLKRAEDKLGSLKKAVVSFATAFAGAVVVREITEIVNQTTAAAVALSHMATTFGMSAEGLETLQHAAEQSGAGVENLQVGLSRLSVQAFAAHSGNVQAAQTFRKLGVSIHDAHGQLKPVNALFGEVADRIKSVKNPTEQVGTAIALFGRGGAALVPLLKRGSAGIEAYAEDIKHLGAEMSEDFIADSKKYLAEQARHKLALHGLEILITGALLPAFTKLEHIYAEGIGWLNRLLKGTMAVQATFAVLGAAAIALAINMALPFLPYIGMALLVIGATLAVILVVDDLWSMLNGGQSVIGFLIKKWNDWINAFVQPHEGDNWFMSLLRQAIGLVVDLKNEWDKLWASIKQTPIGKILSAASVLNPVNMLTHPVETFKDLQNVMDPNGWQVTPGAFGIGAGNPAMPVPSMGGGTNMTASNSVNVTVNANSVTDPHAVAVETGRIVDERMAAHAQDVYSALTPGLAH